MFRNIEIEIRWEGYDETEQSSVNVPVQTEKTSMGYGKPVDEPLATVKEKFKMKLRQATCDSDHSPVVNLRCNHMQYFDNNIIFDRPRSPQFLMAGI